MKATLASSAEEWERQERWSAIALEIYAALCQEDLSVDFLRRVVIAVDAAGIAIMGEVCVGWERDLAENVARSHGHGLQVFDHLRLFCQSTAPFTKEPD
jgi:hypothetical protein